MKYSGKFLQIVSGLLCTGSAFGVTFVNGSFTASDGIDAGLPTGWSATSATPDTINPLNNAPFAPVVYFTGESSDGGTFVAGASVGAPTREGFTQTITDLIVGQEYKISFEQQLSVNSNFDDPGYWIVDFGGQSTNSELISVSGLWIPQEISFIASSASQALTFTSEKEIPASSGNSYLGLDGVTISAIPEPSSSLLLGFVGLVAAFNRRRR